MSTSAMSAAACPRCGAPRPPSAEACPRCLLQLGLHLVPRDPEPSQPTSRPAPATRSAPTPAELAAAFPGLEIEAEIGRGGMGVVYRARQRKLDRLVALKILAPELSGDPAFAERFLREARALARLSHDHIVAVHDFGETDGLCWLLMEHVDGVDLRRAMETGQLAPEQALAIVPQICDALACAHELGIVHRDIKPENVLLDREGLAKIADFGLAKLVDPTGAATLTGVDQAMGTPHYMAPEQMRGARDVDHRADIYSLGVVLYEMLTGQLPVGRFDPPSKRVRVDVRLDDVVLHALESEPERRYQSVTEVKTDVERIGSTPPPAALPEPVELPARERTWTPRRLRIATIVLFVVAAKIAPDVWGWGWAGLALCWLLVLALGAVAFLTALSSQGPRPREGLKRWRLLDLWCGAGMAAVLGIALLGMSVAASWERGTPHYTTPMAPPTAGMEWSETAARQKLRLFQPLGGGELPALAAPSVISHSEELRPTARSPRAWFLGGLAMLLFAGALASYRWRFSCLRGQVGAIVVPTTLMMMAVLLGGLRYKLPFVGDRVRASTGLGGHATLEGRPAQVAAALTHALQARGYEIHLSRHEEWVERSTLDPLVAHFELRTQPRSILDRWDLGSGVPRRRAPAYHIEVLGRPGRDDSGLIWNAGLLDVEADERGAWQEQVAALLDDVRARLAVDGHGGG